MSETVLSREAADVSWLLVSFTKQTAGVRAAVAVSADGLLIATSPGLDRSIADRLGATISGLRSLSQGAATALGAGVLGQVIVEMSGGYLFVAQISGGSSLGVLTDPECDVGLVGYEMALLVKRFGSALTVELISELQAALVF